MRRRVGRAAQVAAEAEVADADGVGAVLVPDDVEGRAGTELPARYGAGAHAGTGEGSVLRSSVKWRKCLAINQLQEALTTRAYTSCRDDR